MTRQHSSLSQRLAASPLKKQRTRTFSHFFDMQKSTTDHIYAYMRYTESAQAFSIQRSTLKLARAAGLKALHGPGSKRPSRFLKNLPALPTIEEEDEEERPVHRATISSRKIKGKTSSGSSKLHAARNALVNHIDLLDEDEDEDEEMTEWDEEKTMVSLLQDEYALSHLIYVPCGPPLTASLLSYASEDDQEDLVALVDKLKTPMQAQSKDLRRYMAETTLPVVQRVKEVHDAMEEEGPPSRAAFIIIRANMGAVRAANQSTSRTGRACWRSTRCASASRPWRFALRTRRGPHTSTRRFLKFLKHCS